ncbi:OmpA family protein [Marinivivus vitaminiproducens]|uniref:OmpA family protein n=1 Tax=Marinivivus vitaminiproducens TaxID=3035935 RepID=UPI0027A5275D|nr:OmpA family protein [Geminicoccaceae bacterium SCSIO 64248]
MRALNFALPLASALVAAVALTTPMVPAFAQEAAMCNPVITKENLPVIQKTDAAVTHKDSYPCPPEPAPVVERVTQSISADVLFDFDRSDIKPEFRPTLDQVAQDLIEDRGTDVVVVGHTDSTGPEAYNQALSERRATSVADYLLGAGVPQASVVRVYGLGETQPVASNDTREGRAQNRRVDITSTNAPSS